MYIIRIRLEEVEIIAEKHVEIIPFSIILFGIIPNGIRREK